MERGTSLQDLFVGGHIIAGFVCGRAGLFVGGEIFGGHIIWRALHTVCQRGVYMPVPCLAEQVIITTSLSFRYLRVLCVFCPQCCFQGSLPGNGQYNC